MKKNFKYAILGAIALGGAVGFSACSSSDEIVDNPNYNPETNAVKTQFTISFPGNVAKTRMTAGTVQAGQAITDFRGMDNIVLYPFGATGAVNTNPISSTSTKLGVALSLTSMIKPTSSTTINNSIPAYTTTGTGLTTGSNSVLFDDVLIPVGTGSFLFYGKAIDSPSPNDNSFYNGKLNMSGDEPASIAFDLDQIYPTGTTDEPAASAVGTALATYLSNIAQATNWAGCAVAANSSEAWYNAALGQLYTDFTSMKAGSSLTVQAAVQDLYSTIRNNTDAVSIAIKTAIETKATPDTQGKLTFDETLGVYNATTQTDNYFPGDVNLPDGAAMLSYNATNKEFSQVVNGTGNTGTTTTDTSTDPATITNKVTAAYADYVYPASLYYYSNSGIKTANSSQKDNYDGSKNWDAIIGGYTDGTSIVPATRSVAILDPIQYAVGRLDTRVKAAAATLYDKKGDPHTISSTKNFIVTGVLIGGQKQVIYDFTTNATATPYTIYDNITKSQPSTTLTATTDYSGYNYTLALETEKDKTVYVAVELLNNSDEDFEGADGVVPAGCKFYMVAELNVVGKTDTDTGTSEPENYPHPDGGTITNTAGVDRVIMQDYKTIANFTIPAGNEGVANTTGLAKAYNTIPDLRAPEMELGLSVDLTWQQGIEYDIYLGTE